MATNRRLRIAISGGGLTSAALANALYPHSHLDVQLYESAPEFSEHGLAVGLAVNGQRALHRLVPDADGLLARAGAVPTNSTHMILGNGPNAGTKVFELGIEHKGKIIPRAALLQGLLAPLPCTMMHTGKKLVAIDVHDTELTLRFADGTAATADAIIGADGLFSFVRSHVLGDHPSMRPVAAGWATIGNLVPYDKARATLGSELFEVDAQYGWIGDKGFLMHDILNDRELVQCIAIAVDPNPSADRRKTTSRKSLDAAFSEWLDGPIATKFLDLVADQNELSEFAMWEHNDAPTYVKGRVCIVGDAAQAMAPWQGSGAARALEDAVVLGTLFARTTSAHQLERAFKSYDAVCRPRAQQIAESSRQVGRIMTGLDPDIGSNPDKMRSGLKQRWDYIYKFDLDQQVAKALALFADT